MQFSEMGRDQQLRAIHQRIAQENQSIAQQRAEGGDEEDIDKSALEFQIRKFRRHFPEEAGAYEEAVAAREEEEEEAGRRQYTVSKRQRNMQLASLHRRDTAGPDDEWVRARAARH